MEKINIAGVEYILRFDFRTLMTFEEVTGRLSTEMTKCVRDVLLLYYCAFKAANPETFNYSFDSFVDLLNESPSLFTTIAHAAVRQGNVLLDAYGARPDPAANKSKGFTDGNYMISKNHKTDKNIN